MCRWLFGAGLALFLAACTFYDDSTPLPVTTQARLLPTATPIATITMIISPTVTAVLPSPRPSKTLTMTPKPSATIKPTFTPTATISATRYAVSATAVPPSPTLSLPPLTTIPVTPTSPTSAAVFTISPPSPPVGPAGVWTYETTITIPTYNYEQAFQPTQPDDPVYPYPRLDFALVGPPAPRSYQAVVLENGYVSLTILPELGGRIYRWVDKATGRRLLYENPVIKPTSWGFRGWWLAAGGIEWVFPVEEHGLNEWRPWNYAVNGASVTVSDIEDRTGMEVGATISLDSDHAYVTIRPWARNDTAESHPYQLWLNAMLTLGGNTVSGQTQFIIPADQVVIHSTADGGVPGSGSSMNWPIHGGRGMSWYGNWSGYLGFFVPANSFVGLYDHAAGQGIVRVHTPGWPAGTKLFGPATLSPALWTDDSSNYVELWSGATSNFWSYATLEPGATVSWMERWYPVSQVGGFSYANESAVLRITDTSGGAEVGVAVSAVTTGFITLWAGEQQVANWPVTLYPGQAFRSVWERPSGAGGSLGLRLEDNSGAVLAQTGFAP